MTVTRQRPLLLRLAAVAILSPLLAACGSSSATPTPAPTASTGASAAPSFAVPSYSLGAGPTDCPTKTPSAMPAGTTANVTMKTPFGNIVVKVTADTGPNAAGAFLALAKCGYYNNVIFHRVVSGFIIQSGDGQYARMPLTTDGIAKMGTGGPGWTVKDDPVKQKYTRGTVAMARVSGTTNSGSSQFFIVLSDSAQDSLGASTANNYAIFGSVTSGMDVVDKIAAVPVTARTPNDQQADTPLFPIPILGTDVQP